LQDLRLTDVLVDGGDTRLHRGTREGNAVLVRRVRPGPGFRRGATSVRHDAELLGLAGVAVELTETDEGPVLIFPDPGLDPLESLPRPDLLGTLRLARAVAEALAAVHDAHIVHGHPNPQTILVQQGTGAVTLVGFDHGTRLDEAHPDAVSPDALAGRLAWLSPEQTGRMNRGVGYRSDFYAFGVTLFELLTGQLPLTAHDAAGWVHAHIARRPRSASEVEPSVPDAVAAIVARLLEKNAEDRYQSARGLLADLDTCLEQLQSTGVIDDFTIGSKDVSDRFMLPSKLYGRTAEVAQLLDLVEGIGPDGARVGLVAGWSGIGKSALVGEVHRPLSERHGYFVVGKSEPHTRHVPYFSLLQALADLCNQLLTEPADQIELWRERVAAAVAPSGKVLVDVLPELGLLLGEQPDVPELGTIEAKNRFEVVFSRFLQAAPSAERSNEVPDDHPLHAALTAWTERGVPQTTLELGPLAGDAVKQLVQDTVGSGAPTLDALLKLVLEKTGANPFFVRSFLSELHEDGLLRFDAEAGSWTSDSKAISAREYTTNVIDHVVGPRTVPPSARLQHARPRPHRHRHADGRVR